ncbi:unnamed protein product [Darwinula stevensoni]|uniref:Uncharacterized protein n=1 Tax=Darwinula stevensoni TaxID=69355 RepID=A0A7R8XH88_9CRUS|nr:unnamed protein product [Darwinula stevensoni]CAG0890206.1 unnamed protein product [Darwinula stevensoni]
MIGWEEMEGGMGSRLEEAADKDKNMDTDIRLATLDARTKAIEDQLSSLRDSLEFNGFENVRAQGEVEILHRLEILESRMEQQNQRLQESFNKAVFDIQTRMTSLLERSMKNHENGQKRHRHTLDTLDQIHHQSSHVNTHLTRVNNFLQDFSPLMRQQLETVDRKVSSLMEQGSQVATQLTIQSKILRDMEAIDNRTMATMNMMAKELMEFEEAALDTVASLDRIVSRAGEPERCHEELTSKLSDGLLEMSQMTDVTISRVQEVNDSMEMALKSLSRIEKAEESQLLRIEEIEKKVDLLLHQQGLPSIGTKEGEPEPQSSFKEHMARLETLEETIRNFINNKLANMYESLWKKHLALEKEVGSLQDLTKSIQTQVLESVQDLEELLTAGNAPQKSKGDDQKSGENGSGEEHSQFKGYIQNLMNHVEEGFRNLFNSQSMFIMLCQGNQQKEPELEMKFEIMEMISDIMEGITNIQNGTQSYKDNLRSIERQLADHNHKVGAAFDQISFEILESANQTLKKINLASTILDDIAKNTEKMMTNFSINSGNAFLQDDLEPHHNLDINPINVNETPPKDTDTMLARSRL